MSREPSAEFARRLRSIDPGLVARWNPIACRWQIVKLWSKGRNRDGSHAKGVKRALLTYQGKIGDNPLYRMRELGAIIGTLTGPNGEYRDLDDSVLSDLRSVDTWRTDHNPTATFDQEQRDLERQEEETHRKHKEMIDHEVDHFVDWVTKDKIDLGAHNAL